MRLWYGRKGLQEISASRSYIDNGSWGCLLSFVYTPHDPNEMQLTMRFIGPGENPRYILGTDYFGRDILSRIIWVPQHCSGKFVAVTLGSVVGSLLGSSSRYGEKGLSAIIMRAIDGLMAFPAFCWP